MSQEPMKSLPMGMFFSMHVCSFLAARKRTVYVYCNVQNRSVHCTCVYMYMFNSTVYMYMYMHVQSMYIVHVCLPCSQLLEKTCRIANVFKKEGVKKGDRVAIYMPASPLLAATMLACARIGAIHRWG